MLLLKYRKILQFRIGNGQFRIGNGYTLFWYAPWTTIGPLCNHVFVVDIHDTDICMQKMYF